MEFDIWNWENCKSSIQRLIGQNGFPNNRTLNFLRLQISLDDGQVFDELQEVFLSKNQTRGLYCLLSGYSNAQTQEISSDLVPFRKLRGGRAFDSAFIKQAILPLEKKFGSNCVSFLKAGKLLGAEVQSYGDCSIKTFSLPLVPVIGILWLKSSEFPAKVNFLFSSNANYYLSTEELAILGQLTSARLIIASKLISQNK